MKKEYWFVIITYVVMQLSSIIGVPLLMFIGVAFGAEANDQLQFKSGAYWIVISFFVALLLVLFFMRKDMKKIDNRNQASIPLSISWGFFGIFLAFFSQAMAVLLEQKVGIDMNSENTEQILTLITSVPLVIFVSSVIGPILEEIIFRKIIFGSLHKRFNFFISALISSIIFGAAHLEFNHILLYTAMGFTFAFLYAKTQRILVSIFAHVAMNTLVVVFQMSLDHENIINNTQNFIGGFL